MMERHSIPNKKRISSTDDQKTNVVKTKKTKESNNTNKQAGPWLSESKDVKPNKESHYIPTFPPSEPGTERRGLLLARPIISNPSRLLQTNNGQDSSVLPPIKSVVSNAVKTSMRSSSDQPEVVTKWSEMQLKPELLNGLIAMGFERPSAIQQRAILPIIKGKDVICQSQSGTGKTAVFCLGALQVVRDTSQTCQAIILSPTRELAEQTSRVVSSLGQFTKVKARTCVGGKSMKDDRVALKGAHVVSGTPGRVYDVIKRGIVESSHVGLFVVDEADEMITSGLKDTIYNIFRDMPPGVQVVLVSATMSAEVMEMSRELLTDPVRVLVKREQVSVKAITQFYQIVEKEQHKLDALCNLYDGIVVPQAIVFCNTRKKVDVLGKQLKEKGFAVTCIHGEMTQTEREKVMQNFRSGTTRVLITTDVLGRGIDVQQVTLVVNYDLPLSKELYIHRIGRAGRWGRKGIAVSFCVGTEERQETLRSIENYYEIKVAKLPKDLSTLEI